MAVGLTTLANEGIGLATAHVRPDRQHPQTGGHRLRTNGTGIEVS
jgi:hypothetical protein